MELPDHFSVSQLRKYLGCPLAYRFKYLDGIETPVLASAPAFGKAVHAAAELLHCHQMNGGVRKPEMYHTKLVESLTEQFVESDVQFKNGESQESLQDEGIKLFDLYLSHRTSSKHGMPLAAEKRITCDLMHPRTGERLGLPFVGYLDLVESDGNGGCVVADLKTASKSYTQDAVDGDLQLSAYALLTLTDTGAMPSSFRIDALVRNKTPKLQTLETTRTVDDLARFWSLARAVRAAIQAGHFYPNPSWICSGCEFAGHCKEWGIHDSK